MAKSAEEYAVAFNSGSRDLESLKEIMNGMLQEMRIQMQRREHLYPGSCDNASVIKFLDGLNQKWRRFAKLANSLQDQQSWQVNPDGLLVLLRRRLPDIVEEWERTKSAR